MPEIVLREIDRLSDPHLPDFLDLYETAFPANERIPVSSIIRILQAKERGEYRGEHFIVACDASDPVLGMALVDILPECAAAYLVYLAVDPDRRSGGIGRAMLDEIVKQSVEWNPETVAVILEVDRPENSSTGERELAERRIQFYERSGGRLLEGIEYTQRVDFFPEGRPMHLMFIPLSELTAERAFEIGEYIFGEDLTRTGESLCWQQG